jgi:hypothetical protein
MMSIQIPVLVGTDYMVEMLNCIYFTIIAHTTLQHPHSAHVIEEHLLPLADILVVKLIENNPNVIEEIRKTNALVENHNKKNKQHRHHIYFTNAFLIFLESMIESKNMPKFRMPLVKTSADVN